VKESVILVDADDNEIGTMQKMEAHVLGKLHRAFSVFIFNTKGELLLQQRAIDKYHSGGKWTNTCCSHPRMGETTLAAAHRRLKEEMGMECQLTYAFNFTYRADVREGIYEHEYDHVYFGVTNTIPAPEPEEVSAYRYMNMKVLENELQINPELYTEWLKICFQLVKNCYKNINGL
jgi:isopentenyl-diphosphate delta-isomerase